MLHLHSKWLDKQGMANLCTGSDENDCMVTIDRAKAQ